MCSRLQSKHTNSSCWKIIWLLALKLVFLFHSSPWCSGEGVSSSCVVLSCWLELSPDSFLVPEQRLEQLKMIRDWPEHIRRDLYLLTFAGHDVDSSGFDINLSDLGHVLFYWLYVLQLDIGFCYLLCSVAISDVLPWRFVIKTLPLHLIWHLASV